MKKRLCCLAMLVAIVITGCSSDTGILKEYVECNVPKFSTSNTSLIGYSELLATDLCVIPFGVDVQEDKKVTASSSLLINSDDNIYLYADNVYDKLYPASTTKILTSLVALNYGNLSDVVVVSRNAANITESGAKLFGFKEGDKIILGDLIRAFLIYSGNDGGIAIAEHISGSEEAFCTLMNEEAGKLGAVGTNFTNSHGLHNDNHYTTAYDLYLIFNEAIKNSTFTDIISTPSYELTYTGNTGERITKTLASTNLYLTETSTKKPEGITIIGGKTGTTMKAGSCLVLLSKDSRNKSYISIILKSESRVNLFTQMSDLLEIAAK